MAGAGAGMMMIITGKIVNGGTQNIGGLCVDPGTATMAVCSDGAGTVLHAHC